MVSVVAGASGGETVVAVEVALAAAAVVVAGFVVDVSPG